MSRAMSLQIATDLRVAVTVQLARKPDQYTLNVALLKVW